MQFPSYYGSTYSRNLSQRISYIFGVTFVMIFDAYGMGMIIASKTVISLTRSFSFPLISTEAQIAFLAELVTRALLTKEIRVPVVWWCFDLCFWGNKFVFCLTLASSFFHVYPCSLQLSHVHGLLITSCAMAHLHPITAEPYVCPSGITLQKIANHRKYSNL